MRQRLQIEKSASAARSVFGNVLATLAFVEIDPMPGSP
jgi:hypothetical protein